MPLVIGDGELDDALDGDEVHLEGAVLFAEEVS